MNDDWTTPTGEHLRDDFADECTPAPDLLPRTDDADAHLLDAFFHEMALDASNDLTRNTCEEQTADDALVAWGVELMRGR